MISLVLFPSLCCLGVLLSSVASPFLFWNNDYSSTPLWVWWLAFCSILFLFLLSICGVVCVPFFFQTVLKRCFHLRYQRSLARRNYFQRNDLSTLEYQLVHREADLSTDKTIWYVAACAISVPLSILGAFGAMITRLEFDVSESTELFVLFALPSILVPFFFLGMLLCYTWFCDSSLREMETVTKVSTGVALTLLMLLHVIVASFYLTVAFAADNSVVVRKDVGYSFIPLWILFGIAIIFPIFGCGTICFCSIYQSVCRNRSENCCYGLAAPPFICSWVGLSLGCLVTLILIAVREGSGLAWPPFWCFLPMWVSLPICSFVFFVSLVVVSADCCLGDQLYSWADRPALSSEIEN